MNFIQERIKENKNQFTNKELRKIKQNIALIKKIYILGLIDTSTSILGGANNE